MLDGVVLLRGLVLDVSRGIYFLLSDSMVCTLHVKMERRWAFILLDFSLVFVLRGSNVVW
jgi:hypothetical protein